MQLTPEQKRRVESLSTDEMAYEIELGRASRLQDKKFAYMKVVYAKRLEEVKSRSEQPETPMEKNVSVSTGNEATTGNHWQHQPLGKIAIAVIAAVLAAAVIYLIKSHLGIQL